MARTTLRRSQISTTQFLEGAKAVRGESGRVEGYQNLATMLALVAGRALLRRPGGAPIHRPLTPTRHDRRWGGDNTDCYYSYVVVDPRRTYRISGSPNGSTDVLDRGVQRARARCVAQPDRRRALRRTTWRSTTTVCSRASWARPGPTDTTVRSSSSPRTHTACSPATITKTPSESAGGVGIEVIDHAGLPWCPPNPMMRWPTRYARRCAMRSDTLALVPLVLIERKPIELADGQTLSTTSWLRRTGRAVRRTATRCRMRVTASVRMLAGTW